MGNTILELKNIVKTFPGVLACKWCPATASVAEQKRPRCGAERPPFSLI